jgi:hypothetical protein
MANYQESLRIFTESGDKTGIAGTLNAIGGLILYKGSTNKS